jgi:hypothetical protein
MREEKQAENWE